MPKSRFNAVRERARASRHNPVGRPNGASANEKAAPSSLLEAHKEDVIPILKSLPLDDSSTSIPASEVLWALTSLSSFFSDKKARTQLLAPEHQLVKRILLQLRPQGDIQIRDAASGCLRNLCIEAGGRIRKSLEDQKCPELCILEICSTAERISLLEGKTSQEDEQANAERNAERKKEEQVSLLSKPKDQLNRKERRQLAKVEASGARKGVGAPETLMEGIDRALQAQDASPTNQDDEAILHCSSHLTNLLSILWCLAEISSETVEACHQHASVLATVFCSAIDVAMKTVEQLSSLDRTKDAPATANGRIDVGQKDEKARQNAMLKLALAAGNVLVTLTDDDQHFCAALMGRNRDELRQALKSTKKNFVLLGNEAESLDKTQGTRNIAALLRSIVTLETLPSFNDADREPMTGRRHATSLALLSAAAIRNVRACLPDRLCGTLQVDEEKWATNRGLQGLTLGDLELNVVLPCLTNILKRAAQDKVEELLQNLDQPVLSNQRDPEYSSAEKTAEEELNNLSLALETLAELAADRRLWYEASGRSHSADADGGEDEEIEVDEGEVEGDQEMREDDREDGDDDGIDASPVLSDLADDDLMHDETDVKDSASSFISSALSVFFTPDLTNALLQLGVEGGKGFEELKAEGEGERLSASLRSTSTRALSVLNNELLTLTSYALPLPSQPAKGKETDAESFMRWLSFDSQGKASSSQGGEQLSKVWRHSFEYASRLAKLPCLADVDDDSSAASDARKALELCLCILSSISRCYEGVHEKICRQVLIIEAAQFTNDPFCQAARDSAGVIESLMAAYRLSKRAGSGKMKPPSAVTSESELALQLSPTPDGVRTHALATLATLVRQPFIDMPVKEKIISLLVDSLDVLPTSTDQSSRLLSLGIRDATSTDAMVVAINGVIDTFANEESSWDPLYRQLRLQSRLKRASVDVKSASRTIDKRRQPALRAAADEAWQNLIAFLDYRSSIV